jgi:hypothetical protein
MDMDMTLVNVRTKDEKTGWNSSEQNTHQKLSLEPTIIGNSFLGPGLMFDKRMRLFPISSFLT